MPGRRNAARRLLLEGVAAMLQRQFHHPGPEPGQGLGDVRRSTFSDDRQRAGELQAGILWEVREVPLRALDPADRSGVSGGGHDVKFAIKEQVKWSRILKSALGRTGAR